MNYVVLEVYYFLSKTFHENIVFTLTLIHYWCIWACFFYFYLWLLKYLWHRHLHSVIQVSIFVYFILFLVSLFILCNLADSPVWLLIYFKLIVTFDQILHQGENMRNLNLSQFNKVPQNVFTLVIKMYSKFLWVTNFTTVYQ